MKKMVIEMVALDPAERKRIVDAMGEVSERWIAQTEKGLSAKKLLPTRSGW